MLTYGKKSENVYISEGQHININLEPIIIRVLDSEGSLKENGF